MVVPDEIKTLREVKTFQVSSLPPNVSVVNFVRDGNSVSLAS